MILTGTALQIALGRTHKRIKLHDANGAYIQSFSVEENFEKLVSLIEAGYEVHGEKRRVKYLCPPKPKPIVIPYLPFEPCWLNQEAAVIRFHGGIGYQGTGVRELNAQWA